MAVEQPLSAAIEDYLAGAEHYLALVAEVGPQQWEQPGLGEWSVRSLVGHTSRSLTTVADYLAQPEPDVVDIESVAGYYARIQGLASSPEVTARGVAAGVDLGDNPVRAATERRDRAIAAITGVEDRRVATPWGGILLSRYLPTRTFELAVHGLDLARAIGSSSTLPRKVLASALATAVEAAELTGQGEQALRILTGREQGPISVV
ncbi:maleylpyruvate isomerase family mycothiol-dependent enzyme [Gordonia rubripertincta]|uniref:maleylpyruvate isomerase family mycothiol-dependent enzyme n=1 Tax=Gordonia rubripertincta TaxID=36822 RepID=UPI00117FB62C|nr:maleylpyruvate isomerase family mycothiol-dependent enzyme [Gordonia rubripertincta]TSD94507.1 maleylpyruvate isomerase family mycothiol-dependent enzyme [Gordonia rubripertincta]